MISKIKKQKQNEVAFKSLLRGLERLFINNPIDLPTTPFKEDDYYTLIRAAEIITSHTEFPIKKDNPEWSYFIVKWNALNIFQSDQQLRNFKTFNEVFSEILKSWDELKLSPYTYRCVASLIRMLGEE